MRVVIPKFSVAFDGVQVNTFHANAGEGLPRHEHEYAHLTACCAGAVEVRKENISVVLTKESRPVILSAAEWHEIEAVEDGTVFVNTFCAKPNEEKYT